MTRGLLILATTTVLMTAVCRGATIDDDDLFAGQVEVKDGHVLIQLCSDDDKAWLNGAMVKFHDKSSRNVELKPGDAVVHAAGRVFWRRKPISARTFEFYHFDRLEAGAAWFTQRTYSVRTMPYGREGVRIFPGELRSTHLRRVVSHEANDGGPGEFPGVELNSARNHDSSR